MEFSKFYLISIILLISAYESSPSLYQRALKPRRRCSTLPTTKDANLRCVMNGFQKCYAICLAGHVLQHNQESTKMAVTCRNGHWKPRTAQCVLSNTCRLKLVDAGEATCKATADSYQCHITCYSAKRSTSTHTCYSKTKTWFPHLPKCAKPKSYSPNLWIEEGNRYVGKIVHYQPGGNGHFQPGRSGYFQPGGHGRPGRIVFYPRGHTNRLKIRPGKKGPTIIQKKGPTIIQNKGPAIIQKKGPTIIQKKGPNIIQNKGPAIIQKKGPTIIQKKGPGIIQKKGPTIIQKKGRNGHHQPRKSGYFEPGGKGRPGRIVLYPRGHTNRLKIRPGKKGPTIIQKKGPTIIQKKGPTIIQKKGPTIIQKKLPTIIQKKGRNGHHQPRKSGYFQPGGNGRPGRIVLYPRGHTNRLKIRPVKKGPSIIQKKFLQKVKVGPRKVYEFEFTVE